MTPRVGDEKAVKSALNGLIASPKSVAFPADAIVIKSIMLRIVAGDCVPPPTARPRV